MTSTSLTHCPAAASSATLVMPVGASVREPSTLRGNDSTTLAWRRVR